MRTYSNICYGKKQDEAQYLDIHLPDCDAFPVFVYFHGGGLFEGDKAEQQVMFRYMTDHGVAVVSANYRMYPKAVYPDFLEDSAEAVTWVLHNIGQYGHSEGVYVGGSSAGGYISMMLCFDKRWLGKYGISPLQIKGFVHDAGQPTCHFIILEKKGLDQRRVIVDDSAPLFHIGTEETYPPMQFIVSDDDMTNRYEQTMLMQSTLRHFGHEKLAEQFKIMHGGHCAYINAVDEKGESIFGQIIDQFIKINAGEL